MRGANCWTDHQMLRSKVASRIRQKHNRQGTSKLTKLNTAKLSTISHGESFEQQMDSVLTQWEEKESSTPDEEWAALQQVKLLNVPGDIDHEALDKVPQRITKTSLDEIPAMAEMARAIAGLKDGKHLGEVEFLLKYGSTEETMCSAECTN
ncbi:hypothetical protein NP493_212g01036 [Ridgeia piscesae]|uniref:Uncharacterized protein n=1 Tax=Ridgeia piscesae TaxID=27915 RepID=A0AAD9P0W6_RIDPI|nr:hypothetical protein NP493_212g01036 [Ridgeia piscesae]